VPGRGFDLHRKRRNSYVATTQTGDEGRNNRDGCQDQCCRSRAQLKTNRMGFESSLNPKRGEYLQASPTSSSNCGAEVEGVQQAADRRLLLVRPYLAARWRRRLGCVRARKLRRDARRDLRDQNRSRRLGRTR
jgi:hypothetical protein